MDSVGRKFTSHQAKSSSLKASQSEIPPLDLFILPQGLGRGRVHDPASRENVNMVRDAERERQILLHEENRQSLRLEILNHAADLADQERCQSLGRLIHQ